MATTAEQRRAHRGPALFSAGFRPFFLFGALWAAAAVLLWMPMWEGHFALPIAFAPLDWHVHETLYGYVPAAVAGFLLTAVPNWTGRLPVVGRPLVALFALWALGRVAILASGLIGWIAAAVLDGAFLVALAALTLREVRAANNARNLKTVAIVALMGVGNLVFHVEVALFGTAAWGTRIGIAATLLLVSLIGGRIVPSFTLNWLRGRPGPTATPFGRFDTLVTALTVAVLALWVAHPEGPITGLALIAGGLAQAARMARWAGWRCWGEKLVFVLHLAYAFFALGFVLVGATLLGVLPLAASAALHAWTVGGIGLMTLAVMTRASLGHTGRPLRATRAIATLYLGGAVAALARIAAGFGVGDVALLHVALLGWLVAFLGFVLVYRPILTTPR